MFEPSVDVAGDMAQLNAGNFTKAGEDLIVNGRTYGWHPDTGTTFPKSGPGIVSVDRAEHKFLKELNSKGLEGARKFGENTLSSDKMKRVLDLWKLCK